MAKRQRQPCELERATSGELKERLEERFPSPEFNIKPRRKEYSNGILITFCVYRGPVERKNQIVTVQYAYQGSSIRLWLNLMTSIDVAKPGIVLEEALAGIIDFARNPIRQCRIDQ